MELNPKATHHAPPRAFHSKKEVAEAIGVSPRTVDNLVAEDVIPSIRIGRRRLFILEEVVEALKAQNSDPNQK